MDILNTRSKVISAFDYRKIDLSESVSPFETDAEQLEQDLMLLRKQHAEMIEADEVITDDIVTLSCQSDNRRFCKETITVRVGKGIFSRELEAGLIGLKCGESRQLSVGSDTVSVHITTISRSVIPELTDETAALWNVDGAGSVEELKKVLIARQRKAYISETAEAAACEVQRLVNEKSEFELDDDELAAEAAEGRKLAYDMLRSSGLDPETASEEEIKAATGATTSEHVAFLEENFLSSFRSTLIAAKLVSEEHIEFSDEDYKSEVEERVQMMDLSEDEVRKFYPFEKFLKQRVSDYYFELVEKRIINYLSEKE